MSAIAHRRLPHGQRRARHRRIEARRHLIDFLRLDLGLMGSHTGCEHGVCGACTVRVDGRIVRGCLVLAASPRRRPVETIEGVSDSGEILDLQEAFIARNACQCGYCTPGMLMTAADLLKHQPRPTREEIREHISGNYCRCTGYHAIVDAVETVAPAKRNRKGRPVNEIIDRGSVDRPNSYIGKSIPRPNAKKLVEGRGQFVDDIVLPRMVHVAFVRSPHPHAQDFRGSTAPRRSQCPASCACSWAADLAKHCEPWVAVLAHLKGMNSAPQLPLPLERAPGPARRWPPWWPRPAPSPRMRPPASGSSTSRCRPRSTWRPHSSPGTPAIHPDLGDNLCFQRVNESGKVDEAFAAAHKVVEATFYSARHTGATLEPRSILADYNRASASSPSITPPRRRT